MLCQTGRSAYLVSYQKVEHATVSKFFLSPFRNLVHIKDFTLAHMSDHRMHGKFRFTKQHGMCAVRHGRGRGKSCGCTILHVAAHLASSRVLGLAAESCHVSDGEERRDKVTLLETSGTK